MQRHIQASNMQASKLSQASNMQQTGELTNSHELGVQLIIN